MNNLTELIAIGHKFGDPNITSTVKAALENPNFKLILVNTSASKIKKEIFADHERVEAIDIKFEDWIPIGIKALTKSAKAQNAKFDAIEEAKKAEKEKINDATKKIQELEQQVRANEIVNQDWTGSGIVNVANSSDPGDSFAENIMLGDDPSFSVGNNTSIFGGTVGSTCPNCGLWYTQSMLKNGNCPKCGTSLGPA